MICCKYCLAISGYPFCRFGRVALYVAWMLASVSVGEHPYLAEAYPMSPYITPSLFRRSFPLSFFFFALLQNCLRVAQPPPPAPPTLYGSSCRCFQRAVPGTASLITSEALLQPSTIGISCLCRGMMRGKLQGPPRACSSSLCSGAAARRASSAKAVIRRLHVVCPCKCSVARFIPRPQSTGIST